MELAVGAPQEEQGRGGIYIFLGRPGGIRTEYSQVWNLQAIFMSSLQTFNVNEQPDAENLRMMFISPKQFYEKLI